MLLLALLTVTAVSPMVAGAQGRPDCSEVLRVLHRRHSSDGVTPDAARIATKLGTDSAWVEKCAAIYGRRVKAKPPKPSEKDSPALTAKVEEKEFEETAREERSQQANIVQGDLDNYKPRNRIREIDPDSSAEWEPYVTHEWSPHVGHQWEPFLLDDDHPNEY